MTEPLVDRESKLWRAIVWTLRISLAVQCLGDAAATFSFGSKIHSLLSNPVDIGGLGWADSTACLVDTVAGWSLVAAAVLILVRPCWPVLLPVALWELALAFAGTWLAGEAGYEVTMVAHAVRIAAPIGLILIDPWPRKNGLSLRRAETACWLFRIAAAAMFFGHGYEALQLNPGFVDLLLMSEKNLLDWGMRQQTAETILYTIGLIDFGVGVLLLVVRSRAIAFYMAFWGTLTALSRLTSVGWLGFDTAYPAAISRLTHAGIPLAIGLYWWLRKRRRIVAESTSDDGVPTDGVPTDRGVNTEHGGAVDKGVTPDQGTTTNPVEKGEGQ